MSQESLSNFNAISAIIVSTLGCGITMMPSVFKELGVKLAIILIIFIGVLTNFSIYALSYAITYQKTKEDQKLSYTDLAKSGKRWMQALVRAVLTLSAFIAAFLFCQMFLELCLNTAKFGISIPEDKVWMVRVGILVLSTAFYYVLFQLESLSALSFCSNISFLVAIIFCVSMSYLGLKTPATIRETTTERPIKLESSLGYIIFALHCQFSFPDIFNEMRNRTLSNARMVTCVASGVATVLYTVVGYLGYRAIGDELGDGPLIKQFADADKIKGLTERYGQWLGLYLPRVIHSLFIPVFFFGTIFNLFGTLNNLQNMLGKDGKKASRRLVASLAAGFLLVTCVVPAGDILDKVFSVTGFLLTTPISFIFPGLFVLATTKKINAMTLGARAMIVTGMGIILGLSILKLRPTVESWFGKGSKQD